MTRAKIPKWADEASELQKFIVQAHAKAANIPDTRGLGDGVHVGIIDSVCQLSDTLADRFQINQGPQNSFIPADDDDTTGHGQNVFMRLSSYAPKATFSIYQAVNADGKLTLSAYADAISKAIDDGVDILNVSSGDPWRGPIRVNPNIQETDRLIQAGITTVAAAGNYYPDQQDRRPPVHCPSAAENVISVASLETICPKEPGDESAETPRGPYYCIPDYENTHPDIDPLDGVYCGEQGCTEDESCIVNQEEREWDRNPLPTGNKPDLLAPMHLIDRDVNDNLYLGGGTSFSTPLVTGSLTCIFSELGEMGEDFPMPREARRAVRSGSRVPDSQIAKYDAMEVRKALGIV